MCWKCSSWKDIANYSRAAEHTYTDLYPATHTHTHTHTHSGVG